MRSDREVAENKAIFGPGPAPVGSFRGRFPEAPLERAGFRTLRLRELRQVFFEPPFGPRGLKREILHSLLWNESPARASTGTDARNGACESRPSGKAILE